ncbi:MAG: hypothetical protein WD737_08220 [Gemmatimonadota bacterium]
MTSWSAVVLALPEGEADPMVSRLPAFLHPVAGRPLIWHSVTALLALANPPEEVVVLTEPEEITGLFDDLPVEIRITELAADAAPAGLEITTATALVCHAGCCFDSESLAQLLDGGPGGWLGSPDGDVIAALVGSSELSGVIQAEDPARRIRSLEVDRRLEASSRLFRVRNRSDLARFNRRTRDTLVQSLMESGVTFLLPETVLVDVDVRIGRDSIVYPGVTIEGQTTIGQETVVGPGCRITDSWIGSGVELKGWNYIAHTSVRNRAILEPYVRRGFD